jgi:hypothetical protein
LSRGGGLNQKRALRVFLGQARHDGFDDWLRRATLSVFYERKKIG